MPVQGFCSVLAPLVLHQRLVRLLFVGLAGSPQGSPGLLVEGAICQHASLDIAPLQVALEGGSALSQALEAQPRSYVLQKPLPICTNQHHNAQSPTVSLLFLTLLFPTAQVVCVCGCVAARPQSGAFLDGVSKHILKLLA